MLRLKTPFKELFQLFEYDFKNIFFGHNSQKLNHILRRKLKKSILNFIELVNCVLIRNNFSMK